MTDVLISIIGQQSFDDNANDGVELVTDGQYSFVSDKDVTLTYMESELTGMEGTKTSFIIDEDSVTMERTGRTNSCMVFSEGKKHHFLYETPFGSSTMGIDTYRICNTLNEHGGNMIIDYVLDLDHAVVGRNRFIISVKELGDNAAKPS